ncbi:MAG TPA: hypothetical protein VGN26_04045 [Armatimonadota bacterium]|jgi:hypothetical protein
MATLRIRRNAARALGQITPHLYVGSPKELKTRAYLLSQVLGLHPAWIDRCCTRPQPFQPADKAASKTIH